MWNWLYRLAGKNAAGKLNLQGGTVDTKKWYQSKTVWTAIIAVILSGVSGVSSALGHPITIPNYVYEFLAGMGLYGLRTADKPLQ